MSAASVCLSCRHYDDKPPFAGDLPDLYGMCTWRPAALPKPTMMSCALEWELRSNVNRMLSKRGLIERPDLFRECPAWEPVRR